MFSRLFLSFSALADALAGALFSSLFYAASSLAA
jgi:hypothetical protein